MTDRNAHDTVVMDRSFDAPVDVIWQLWTDPQHFGAWYGPEGATIPVAKMDVRVGGKRLICMEMQTPGGQLQMWFAGEYREVVANKLLVYTESMSDQNGEPAGGVAEGHPVTTEVRVELWDEGGSTRMVLTHTGIAADSPGAAGWAMALDKLAAHVRSFLQRS